MQQVLLLLLLLDHADHLKTLCKKLHCWIRPGVADVWSIIYIETGVTIR